MKKMALLMTLVMAVSLAGCGGNSKKTESKDTDGKGAKTEFSASMVCDTGGINDQSFNQSSWEGLQEFAESEGAKVNYLESTQASDFATNFDKLSDEDLNLIWGIGYNVADALKNSAEMNPDKTYAIVDYDFGEETPDNVVCTTFNVQYSSFLVGYIAGLMTETDHIGYIGGMKSPTMDLFEYGYRAGAGYAAKELNKEITVDVQYAESFTDSAKGKAMAKSMYSSGCDILFHAAGGVGVGAIEEAAEEGKWIIGVDRDQSYLAPENILTSALKVTGVATKEISKKIKDGEDIAGQSFAYGLKEGAVGIPSENPNLADGVYDKTMEVQKLIEAGEITPPSTEEEFNQFGK